MQLQCHDFMLEEALQIELSTLVKDTACCSVKMMVWWLELSNNIISSSSLRVCLYRKIILFHFSLGLTIVWNTTHLKICQMFTICNLIHSIQTKVWDVSSIIWTYSLEHLSVGLIIFLLLFLLYWLWLWKGCMRMQTPCDRVVVWYEVCCWDEEQCVGNMKVLVY